MKLELRPGYKYMHDEDFFSRETPEAFYWAGFIAADGCMKERKDGTTVYLAIGLARADEKHVRKFKECIRFTGPITRCSQYSPEYDKTYYSSRVTITITKSKVLKDLRKFNIEPRKSLIYTFPKWLKHHPLVSHFIRGYFDGDGTVGVKDPCPSDIVHGRKVSKLGLGFRGTIEFLNDCQEILMTHCNIKIKHKVTVESANIGALMYCGNRIVLRIAEFLYKGYSQKMYLERKRKVIYNGFFDCLPEDFRFKPVIGINKKTGKVIRFGSTKEAGEHGFCRQSISDCINGRGLSHKGLIWNLDKESRK
jgi:hypothetical protein